jgi:hypothetical protein
MAVLKERKEFKETVVYNIIRCGAVGNYHKADRRTAEYETNTENL